MISAQKSCAQCPHRTKPAARRVAQPRGLCFFAQGARQNCAPGASQFTLNTGVCQHMLLMIDNYEKRPLVSIAVY
jgi:hypothetical protein